MKSERSERSKNSVCSDAIRLLDLYSEAASQSLILQQAQFQAVVADDAESNRFDLLIHAANERKQNAKYLYLNHLHNHGCSYEQLRNASKDLNAVVDAPLTKTAGKV